MTSSDTVGQMQDPVYQAAKVGFRMEAYLSPKESNVIEVWMTTKISDDKFTITEQNPPNKGREQIISASECMANWKPYKARSHRCYPVGCHRRRR